MNDVKMNRAVAKNARLIGINFTGADLRNADFSNSDLEGCIFTDANLSGAKFCNTNLNNAIFHAANLKKTDFTGATVTLDALANAKDLEKAILPYGTRYQKKK